MHKEEMKLIELDPQQVLSERFFQHEYVIDRIALLRARPELVSKIASISMRFRAETVKLQAQMLELESKKLMEMSETFKEMR
jgi:hypothetical protein